MNVKHILLTVLFLLMFCCCSIYAQNCETARVYFKTTYSERPKYFLFLKLNRVKYKRKETITDENGKEILQCTMYSTTSGDTYYISTFKRMVIIDKEIHRVELPEESTYGMLWRYDFCGNLIARTKIERETLYEKYNFVSIPLLKE